MSRVRLITLHDQESGAEEFVNIDGIGRIEPYIFELYQETEVTKSSIFGSKTTTERVFVENKSGSLVTMLGSKDCTYVSESPQEIKELIKQGDSQ